MNIGCYYRCPITIEDADDIFPRFFVLAQVVEYNDVADAVKVKMHDLLGSGLYYSSLFQHNVFRVEAIDHCEALPGGIVEGYFGKGTVISRTTEPNSENEPYWYWIKKEDGTVIKECESNLKIEYSQMNYAPEKQLRNYEFQNPTWFINHIKVSRNMHLINNATYGFSILAGCRAFLLPHQISTVARCFETMPIRYMLADEVGLGKTIEACSILRIMMSENKAFRSLIIVPGALAEQWRNELHYKFNVDACIHSYDTQTCIIPIEELSSSFEALDTYWDMVIVDETHRLLENTNLYQKIQKLSRSVNHILLLSATPIQDRNEEYRRLLALLNPEQYSGMSSERFSWMVKKQQRIQRTVNQQLGRLNRYDEYRDIIIDKLTEVTDTLEDSQLKKLLAQIDVNSEDEGLDIVKQCLAYICENYRVERRVIRNRRLLIAEKMAQRTLYEVPYTPLSADDNYNEIAAIQNTLSYLSENGQGNENYIRTVAIPLLSALFSSPWAYEAMLSTLRINDTILLNSALIWKQQAEDEHALVSVALTEDPDLIKGRLMHILDYIDQETDLVSNQNYKIVLFTGFTETLSAFLSLFNSYYENTGIFAVPFSKNMSREELEDSVYAFQNDSECRLIVCDETGGEGRNFQNASEIIHLDMPWNANSLEQRIGRLDRLGRDANMDVKSVVIYAKDTIEEQLFSIWKNGLKLFEQSLSGLEIITGELNNLIAGALCDDIYTGLLNAFDDILNQAEEMRESVEDEQDFDLGTTLYKPLSQGIDNVLSIYASEDSDIFATAMMSWGHQAGLAAEAPTEDGLIEFNSHTFSVNAAKQSLLIPPNWDAYINTYLMRREGKILGTFNRKTAAMREDILFFAPGDPVYDAIISNAAGCSRGRCTAISLNADYNYQGIVFIYNVSPSIDELLNKGIDMQVLSQFRMYLPLEQIIVCIPLDNDSKTISDDQIIDTIKNMRLSDAGHIGRRGAPRGMMSSLESFISWLPPSKWEPLVDKIVAIANKKAIATILRESGVAEAKKEMLRILHGYRAECLYFERDLAIVDKKKEIFETTYRALKNAKPELDAVCYLRVKRG